MRFTESLIPTLKENPQEAECKSHRLMLRSGFVRKLASGTYSYLPLGLKVLRKIEKVIREEMNRAGGLEVLLPALHPSELWQETGRRDILREVMFAFKDRHGRENVLGPTHEEVITDLARREIRSYRQLPLLLYQIQTKFRDEARPRSGVIRSREFIMKDAYSFHPDDACLGRMYEKMKAVYCRIFDRCGLKYYIVEADPGAMGGGGSQEFVLFSEAGEDRVVRYGDTDRVLSSEMAPRRLKGLASPSGKAAARQTRVHTPGHSSVEGVAEFLKKAPKDLVKTMIYQRPDKKLFAVLVRGDHEVSDFKVRKEEPGATLAPRDAMEALGTAFGFSGPFGLNGIPFYADEDVIAMRDFVTGSNVADHHLVGVTVEDIFSQGRRITIGDYRHAVPGDAGELDGKPVPLSFHTAIELGHIFKLNLRYSEPMRACYLDASGKEKPLVMGCYGIGVNRIFAAAIEQGATDKAFAWPTTAISPFEVLLLPLRMDDEPTRMAAESLYTALMAKGRDAGMDDRPVSAGIKFNDADLIGVPIEVIIGPKNLASGEIEIRFRADGTSRLVKTEDAVKEIENLLDKFK